MNEYKELVDELKKYTYWLGQSGSESHEIHPIVCDKAVNAIEELVAGIESLSKELFELRIILDMYGGEEGITEAFKKAEKLDVALEEIKYLKMILKQEGVTVLHPKYPGDRTKWNVWKV